MPGHKGASLIGVEQLDITEILGADSLYEADGIIAQSEANASMLFGCRTLYSTEGSSQCIRAMLHLILLHAKNNGKRPLVFAGRNAHKAFITAAALTDLDVEWLYSKENTGYLSCSIPAFELEEHLQNAAEMPTAVYLTCPDYLGKLSDIKGMAEVCHRYGVLLAVDNAHGAYLRFLPESLFPIDLGADIACSSAHKTLPTLTGGAYLHLSNELDLELGYQAKNALMIYGSTSPSYIILESLDATNQFLDTYPEKLSELVSEVEKLKVLLSQYGYSLYGDEPLKITIAAKEYGYSGYQLAEILRSENIEPEFADPDYLTLMLSAEFDSSVTDRIEAVLKGITKKVPIKEAAPTLNVAKKAMTLRDAMLSPSEILPLEQCLGRVLALPTVGCPPAVPILVCGEELDSHAIRCFEYYGINSCLVVK